MEVVSRQLEMWLGLGSKVRVGSGFGRPLHRADLGGLGTGGDWRARRDSPVGWGKAPQGSIGNNSWL